MDFSQRRAYRERNSEDVIAYPLAKSLSFSKALEIFLQAQDAAFHSKETRQDYRAVISLFIRFMQDSNGYTTVQEVTEADILGWLAHLRNSANRYGRPYSSRTIETYFRDVSVFLNWLTDHKHLSVNPMTMVPKPKAEKPLIRVFTEDELERLDAACERSPDEKQGTTGDERKALTARDRAFLWLLLSTGIRLSEACGLLFSDIDWSSGMIYVRGKGAKERRVPIGKVAKQHLLTYVNYWRGAPKDDNEHVFLNLWGTPMRRTAGHAIFERLKKVSGITDKRVSAHTCRHWFAVNSIKNGMPSTVLQTLLGHERLEMINIYVRLAEQDTRVLYDRFSPVDSLSMHHRGKGKREQLREWRKSRKQASKD